MPNFEQIRSKLWPCTKNKEQTDKQAHTQTDFISYIIVNKKR